MCNKITKISEQNKFQWIGICSHGAGYVVWRTVQVCLPAIQLESLMNKALAGSLPAEKYGNDYLLWLNNVAIKLSEKDYHQIVELFAFAVEGHNLMSMQPSMSDEKGKMILH